MAQNLKSIIYRWKHIDKFFQALFVNLCTQMVDVLVYETPGKVFPEEWTFDIRAKAGKTIAEVWNKRLGSNTRSGTDKAFKRIAGYLNDGTDPHKIKPVIAQALHWEEDGQDFFSKGHVVSGIKASHFVEKTDRVVENFKRTIPDKFADYINHGRLPG